MKGGKNGMFIIFKEVLSIDSKNKGGDAEALISSKVSGMTQIRLYVAKKSS